MRVAPDLQVVVREADRLVVRDAEDGDVGNGREAAADEDAVGQGGVVVAGQDHHGAAGIGQQAAGAIEHAGADAVVVEGVAGEQDDVGVRVAGGGEHGGQACGAVAVLGGGGGVIDMQVGAVDEEDVHWGRQVSGHGWESKAWGGEGKEERPWSVPESALSRCDQGGANPPASTKTDGPRYSKLNRGNGGAKPTFNDGQRGGFVNRSLRCSH